MNKVDRNDPGEAMSMEEGRVITPSSESSYRLDDLLARITPENLHSETDTGRSVGNEAG